MASVFICTISRGKQIRRDLNRGSIRFCNSRIRQAFAPCLFCSMTAGSHRFLAPTGPVPGVHNSRWAQGPGHRVVRDRKQWPRLQRYVEDIVGSFREDERIGMWDLYNEPGNALLPLAALPNYLQFRDYWRRYFVTSSA